MKTKMSILLIVAMALTGPITSQAQRPGTDYAYKPWAEYNGDTARYLKENFQPGYEPFNFRPLKEILNKLELPIKGVRYSGKPPYISSIQLVFEEISAYRYKEQFGLTLPDEYVIFIFDNSTGGGVGNIPYSTAKSIFKVDQWVITPMTGEIMRWLYTLTVSRTNFLIRSLQN